MKHFALATVLCLSATSAFAQCLTNRVSAHKEARMSSAVVVATVTAATPAPEAWDFLDGINYTVHVESKVRGKAHVNTNLTIFSENTPQFFPMYVGQRYVLYLQPKWGRNQVDGCGNSHAADQVETAKQPRQLANSGL